ncbi:MAG: outer membrane protein heavy metal efflux system [Blastocatellia bacterium]|jgi:cobalt-zinc-cadmium efflux system outer membrane protein|nr:outer membrane protein heavy metal efflux system [Blastocatellia bacterium]
MARRDVSAISITFSVVFIFTVAASNSTRAQSPASGGNDRGLLVNHSLGEPARAPFTTTKSVTGYQPTTAEPSKGASASVASPTSQQPTAIKRSITISDAVAIFVQQNYLLIAARYDIDTADAEKLTARLRPNPEFAFGSQGLPLNLSGNFINQQQFSYGISQTLELGGKRHKRIDAANANSDVAQAQFQMVLWQLTNDLKKKFYTVLLNESLLKLAQENQKTFAETVKHTSELVQLGEISGLDLTRLEVEKLKFDTDVANAERDYELAVRDLRVALGGDYRATDIEVVGSVDYQPYQFSFSDLRDKALAARPDLKAAQLTERAADASIRLQNAQRIPDLNLGAGVNQVPEGTSTYTVGIGFALPIHDRNQGERAKALIEKKKAQNQEQLITNQVVSDVDKALIAFEIQKRRVDLYRSGVLTKVNDIQNLTEFSLRAGESSTLELLDAIRTRRETLASFYQTLFDYQAALLDLELATATPLQK